MALERLQKILARAGVSARRKAEELISARRVTVNGEIVSELGARADPTRDRIALDGRVLEQPRTSTYIVLWKPAGVVTTAKDELDRRTVIDLVRCESRVFPVGRLDMDAEGVLLLTDDGDLAAALTHPSGEVPKVYRAKVRGRPSPETLKLLEKGLELEDGFAIATHARWVESDPDSPRGKAIGWVELTVTEGRNHLVKRMLDAVGHPVLALRRLRFGPLDLEGLRVGKWRHLRHEEVRRIRSTATQAIKKRRNAGPRPKRTESESAEPETRTTVGREQRGVFITRAPKLDRDDEPTSAARGRARGGEPREGAGASRPVRRPETRGAPAPARGDEPARARRTTDDRDGAPASRVRRAPVRQAPADADRARDTDTKRRPTPKRAPQREETRSEAPTGPARGAPKRTPQREETRPGAPAAPGRGAPKRAPQREDESRPSGRAPKRPQPREDEGRAPKRAPQRDDGRSDAPAAPGRGAPRRTPSRPDGRTDAPAAPGRGAPTRAPRRDDEGRAPSRAPKRDDEGRARPTSTDRPAPSRSAPKGDVRGPAEGARRPPARSKAPAATRDTPHAPRPTHPRTPNARKPSPPRKGP
jgi:23S rRNA pseudouridine2605 synthase